MTARYQGRWALGRVVRAVSCAAIVGLAALYSTAAADAAATPVIIGVAPACGSVNGTNTTYAAPYVSIVGYNPSAADTVTFGSAAGTVAASGGYTAEGTPPAGGPQLGVLKVAAPASPLPAPGSGQVDIQVNAGGGNLSAITEADKYTYTTAGLSYGLCGLTTAFSDPATGQPMTLAGGHPNFTVAISVNDAPDAITDDTSGLPLDGPAADTKDLSVKLPSGVIGYHSAIPTADLFTPQEIA